MSVIDRLAAKLEIAELLARYCRGIDRLDTELIASVYHEDAYDDHGTFKGSGKEFARQVIGGLSRYERTMHFLGTSLIEVEGNLAHGETYCVAYHRSRPVEGKQEDFVAGVRLWF